MRPGSLKVLVIEDDHQDFVYLQELLENQRNPEFVLTNHSRLEDGLRSLACDRFDVVILDLSLPDSHGYATFATLREHASDLPVVLMTGNDNNDLALATAQEGAQDYLVKQELNRNLLVRTLYYAVERNRLIRELQKSKEVEKHLAYHDVLTGLPNRQLFYDRLQQVLAHARRTHDKVAVLFLDLNNFKPINDCLGHEQGDLLLKAVSNRLQISIRESDTIARIGGDEFTIILDSIYHTKDVSRIVEKIYEELERPFEIGQEKITVGMSIGISLFPADGQTLSELIKKADMAMYRAKKHNKRYQFYNVSRDTFASERLQIESMLRQSLTDNQLVIYYQPQVNIKTKKIVGVEALVRWQHPQHGLLLPAKFIAMAEETGLIVPLGEWVLRSACEQNIEWLKRGMPPLRLSINVSARQFRATQLHDLVGQVLGETDLDPSLLVLEITEACAMQDVNYTIETMQGLKSTGIKISVDDFGTGYASLNYLKRFPFDILKIDRSFVKGLHKFQDDWSIVSAIVDMSHRLKLCVLAEGVECAEQMAFLQALNCDEYQGYFRSRPVPAEEFFRMMSREREDGDPHRHEASRRDGVPQGVGKA